MSYTIYRWSFLIKTRDERALKSLSHDKTGHDSRGRLRGGLTQRLVRANYSVQFSLASYRYIILSKTTSNHVSLEASCFHIRKQGGSSQLEEVQDFYNTFRQLICF